MTKTPTLYRLAANRQYDQIPARVRGNPDDLFWTDRYGSTALHILCQTRTVDRSLLTAVDAIVRISPEQVAWPNVATWTPLHFAVEKRLHWGGDSYATALILRLIRACPAAVSIRTHAGFKTKTPFHIACEADADYLVLRSMLSINPTLATEPFVKTDVYSISETPLQLLWKFKHHPEQTKLKMALLLRAAHYGTVQGRHFRILNAACSVRCPRDYFDEILKLHVHQINQADEYGMYAVHYAVQNAQVDSQLYTQFVIASLLQLYPTAAARPNAAGRLALHLAIDRCLTWHKGGVRELTARYSHALRQADPLHGLIPFLSSAIHAHKSRLHLSTTYELLLACPEMAQGYTHRDEYDCDDGCWSVQSVDVYY